MLAWVFGLGKYGLGASWVYVSIHVYGNAPPPLAALLVVLFVALLAFLFSAPLGWIYARLRPAVAWSVADVMLFSAAWVLMDWVSSWLFTGFPWLLPGYAFMDTVMLASAPVVGVLGMGFTIVVSIAALTAMIVSRRVQIRMALLFFGPLLVALGLSQARWVEPAGEYEVALVQGNIDQRVKWRQEEAAPNVRKHLELSEPHWDADLVVWPEAAVTFYPQQAQGLLDDLNEKGRLSDTNIVLGIPGLTVLPGGGYEFQNLAMGLGEARGRFAKYHLVPFGEYVPFEDLLRGLIEFFDLPMSSSTPGAKYQPNLTLSFGEAAMAICYEIAYPDSIRQRAEGAAVLMTISNDTWFGDSIGPLQHMQIARMRAVENGRWLLRATNNGVTGIVDHDGRVTASLPQFEAGVLRGKMSVMQGRTPYNLLGHWPVLIVLLLVIAGVMGLNWFTNRSEKGG
jgi:apolipoprotein N-acyltransferase